MTELVNVSQITVRAQPTAVIAETTTWEAYPRLWPRLLDEVWSAVRPERETIVPGRNVMLYRDDVPNVEVGVEVAGRSRRSAASSRLPCPAAPSSQPGTAGAGTSRLCIAR